MSFAMIILMMMLPAAQPPPPPPRPPPPIDDDVVDLTSTDSDKNPTLGGDSDRARFQAGSGSDEGLLAFGFKRTPVARKSAAKPIDLTCSDDEGGGLTSADELTRPEHKGGPPTWGKLFYADKVAALVEGARGDGHHGSAGTGNGHHGNQSHRR
jgi:hypothetical protein